jgi:hypothetical protein
LKISSIVQFWTERALFKAHIDSREMRQPEVTFTIADARRGIPRPTVEFSILAHSFGARMWGAEQKLRECTKDVVLAAVEFIRFLFPASESNLHTAT